MASDWKDPDDAPELDDRFFERAQAYVGDKPVQRGRPPERGVAKVATNIRLDVDVVERLKAGGPGWQTRANGLLRRALGL